VIEERGKFGDPPAALCAAASPCDAARRFAKILHKVVAVEKYSDVGCPDDNTEATKRLPPHEADWATTSQARPARPTGSYPA